MLMFDKKKIDSPKKIKTRKVQTAVDLRKMRRTFFQGIDELQVGETESTFLRRALTLYVWV